MPVHVNIGGVWKDSIVHVNVGGVWKAVDQAHVNVATSWKESLDTGPTVSVSPIADGATNVRENANCFAGAQWNLTKYEYEFTASGGTTSKGIYIDVGDAADVWVLWHRTAGSLGDWNYLGSGVADTRLVCSTTRSFAVRRTTTGTDTITGYFEFWDAASGGNLLDTTSTVTWSAERDFVVCPLCCFTPDTLITLAGGLMVPIVDVKKGDMIDTFNGPQEVSEVITRTNRTMYRLHFADGRTLDASDDHPFHVRGKGPASINPQVEYKDLGIPTTLDVGDLVTDSNGIQREITGIEPIEYPGTVYTFGNSLFYANGLLVY